MDTFEIEIYIVQRDSDGLVIDFYDMSWKPILDARSPFTTKARVAEELANQHNATVWGRSIEFPRILIV